MKSNLLEGKSAIGILLLIVLISALFLWYVFFSPSARGSEPYFLLLVLFLLFVIALVGFFTVTTKGYSSPGDVISWSFKGLGIDRLESILRDYPQAGSVVISEKTEGKLTAEYLPIVGGKSKVELSAEKTPAGTSVEFKYRANLFRNGIEFLIVFIVIGWTLIGAILALMFFDRRNKENKFILSSIYNLINYIEQNKK